ncbi:hypothetical protein H2198_006970 [Neophaeococcomyces mojaviensis]|uniref:Uncharacterized protein n=1 Tax=Neophaeococcomyces mojaviensis TaxID=3383035 RepID=A0ACC3A1E8_9EURO|nr:hypothetical protein H2198_006970 [Knufia sp. JES_112]
MTQSLLNDQFTTGTGWTEERFDGRDKYYVPQQFVDTDAASGINLRTHSTWSKHFPDWFYDQGSWGTCVANASAMCFIFEWAKQGYPKFDPSRLFIYYNARKLGFGYWHDPSLDPSNPRRDLGSHVRMAFKGLDKFGVPTESEWQYIDKNFAVDPLDAVDSSALKQRALTYERLDPDNPEEIAFRLKPHERRTIGNLTLLRLRQCIAEGHPVVFGFHAYEPFANCWVEPQPNDDSEGIWSFKDLPTDNQVRGNYGGHAVLAIGFHDAKQRILCQNSWGAGPSVSWGGGKGVFWLGYNWIRDYEATADFWMMRLLVSDPSVTPTPGPEPPNPPHTDGRKVTVNFTDNYTGANVGVDVTANQGDQAVANLLAHSTVGVEGFITTVELQANRQNSIVVVKRNGSEIGRADGNANNVVNFSRSAIGEITTDLTAS